MRCGALWFWLALESVRSFETQSTWVANNATGCLDDPYYFDVFFLNLGRGTCRLSEYDTSGNGYGTAWRPSPTPPTLEECLSLCFSLSYCTAAEFRTTTGDPRCEIWNQTVGYLRGSGSYVCVSQKEVDCSYFVGKNCTAEIYDRNVSAKLARLHSACPNTCTEVVPSCPANFTFRTTTVGGLYLTAAGEQETQKDQYSSGYNLIFNVKGQESATTGFLELTSLSADGTIKEVEERAKYLISRVGAKLLLGPYGDETFEAVAQVAEAAKAVLVGPVSKRNESVAPRDTVFSLTRPYEETLLGPFEAIHQKGVATVSYIGPSESRAAALGLQANYRTCEKLPQTAEQAQLVFLRGEVLEDVSAAAWSAHVSDAVQRLLTPRPEVIVCCDSTLVCAFDIPNATYQSQYDAKAFILLDDQHLTIPLNRATVDAWNNPTMDLWLQQRMMDMGQVQSLEMINQWKSLSYSTMSAHIYGTTWPVEMQEMMKECLVVSEWDRNSVAAAGFMFLQHYQVRNHAQPHSAAAWTSVAALLEAITLANSTNPQAVSAALMSLQMDSVVGHVTFDATGHRAQPSSVVQLAVAAEWLRPPGMLRFDVRYLQPHGRDTLKYPKQTWRESYCWNQHLTAPDGLNYGLVLNNDTGLEECSPCSNGQTSRWDHRTRKRLCESCAAGTETLQGTCRPCQAGYFSDLPGSPKCSPCSAGSFQGFPGQSSCQLCPAGSFSSQSASASCTSCTDTWDATNPEARPRWAAAGSAACETCLVGASCEPDANGVYGNFTNSDGFYLFPAELLHTMPQSPLYPLFRCNHGNGLACLKGGRCYVHPETQKEAMTGPMCGTCRPGYAKPIGQPLELCRHCGSRTMNFLGLGLQLLTVFCMAAFLMIVNFLSDYSKPKNILSIILKQFFNYTQMATAVLSTGGDHGLYGGFSVVGIFDMVQDYLGFSSSAWVPEAGACLIQELLPSWGIQKVITLVGLAWFPGTAVISTMVFLIVKLFRRLVFKKTTHLRHLKTWLMVNFFLYIPRVNRLLLANFKCQTYDTSRLMLDPTVACWDRDHALWQTLSWIGIGVFSVGGPLLLYLILRRYEHRQLLGTYRVLRTYGFLFAGFEPDFYYFECVYMFRKLCFEFVMTMPGMTSENEEILGRINSSSVAFVASVFFALHMACQPYDNRDYFILDHIETASLRAILVTAFLQLWCLNTNEADGILHNTWLREVRNVICTVVILLFHLRFFWLFFYGIARRRIQSCISACRGRDFSHGIVKFVPDGLQLHNLNGKEEMLLKTLVSEIFDLHMQAKRKIAYDQWSGSLQMLCLEARRQHIENELLALDKVGNTLRSWREISRKLFHGSRVGLIFERIFDRMESAYGLVSKSGSYENSKKQKDKELEDLKIFCADSLNKILNKEFRVDELQDSMLSLGKSICNNKRIGGLGENMKVEDETMSQALEFYVGPLDMDEHVAIAIQERANIKEVTELRKEVDERQTECADLRRLLGQYRAQRKQGLGTDEERPVDDPRAERLEELEVQLKKSMEALSEAQEERDKTQAEVYRLQGDLDKEGDLKQEAKGVMEEQQSKIHSLEEQLRKLQQHRISCWSCHTKLPEDAQYCYTCGKALHDEL